MGTFGVSNYQFCTISVIEQKHVRIFAQGEIFVRLWRRIVNRPYGERVDRESPEITITLIYLPAAP